MAKERTHNMTPIEMHEFAERVAAGEHPTDVAEDFGFKDPRSAGSRLAQHPLVREKIRQANMRVSERMDITRATVVDGFMDAIEIAKLQADPMAMIAGYREIAKTLGLNAPEQKHVAITAVVGGELTHKLQNISTAELERLVTGETVEALVIEGESRLVSTEPRDE